MVPGFGQKKESEKLTNYGPHGFHFDLNHGLFFRHFPTIFL